MAWEFDGDESAFNEFIGSDPWGNDSSSAGGYGESFPYEFEVFGKSLFLEKAIWALREKLDYPNRTFNSSIPEDISSKINSELSFVEKAYAWLNYNYLGDRERTHYPTHDEPEEFDGYWHEPEVDSLTILLKMVLKIDKYLDQKYGMEMGASKPEFARLNFTEPNFIGKTLKSEGELSVLKVIEDSASFNSNGSHQNFHFEENACEAFGLLGLLYANKPIKPYYPKDFVNLHSDSSIREYSLIEQGVRTLIDKYGFAGKLEFERAVVHDQMSMDSPTYGRLIYTGTDGSGFNLFPVYSPSHFSCLTTTEYEGKLEQLRSVWARRTDMGQDDYGYGDLVKEEITNEAVRNLANREDGGLTFVEFVNYFNWEVSSEELALFVSKLKQTFSTPVEIEIVLPKTSIKKAQLGKLTEKETGNEIGLNFQIQRLLYHEKMDFYPMKIEVCKIRAESPQEQVAQEGTTLLKALGLSIEDDTV